MELEEGRHGEAFQRPLSVPRVYMMTHLSFNLFACMKDGLDAS